MTVKEILGRYRLMEPTCTAQQAQEVFDFVHKEILKRTQARNSTVAITLTANTREYDFNADTTMVHEAYYQRTSDPASWIKMEPTSTDHMNVYEGSWRSVPEQGEPYRFYITSAISGDSAKPQIGFVPIPATSSNPTYPRVVCYVTSYADLRDTDVIPTNLLNENVYLMGMSFYYGQRAGMPDLDIRYSNYMRELDRNVDHVKNLQTDLNTSWSPSYSITSTRVV